MQYTFKKGTGHYEHFQAPSILFQIVQVTNAIWEDEWKYVSGTQVKEWFWTLLAKCVGVGCEGGCGRIGDWVDSKLITGFYMMCVHKCVFNFLD